MSTDADTPADADAKSDYDEMLDALDGAIESASAKVESGRVYNPESESIRVKWIRALAYTVNVRRQVTRDKELEELDDRLTQIEEERL